MSPEYMCVYGFFLEIKCHCTHGGVTVLCGLKINMESPLSVPFSCNSICTYRFCSPSNSLPFKSTNRQWST